MWHQTLKSISEMQDQFYGKQNGFTSIDVKVAGYSSKLLGVMVRKGWIQRFGEPVRRPEPKRGESTYMWRWVFTDKSLFEVQQALSKAEWQAGGKVVA